MQWEKEFLKIVQEYQKDPKNSFTFAYMAEVKTEYALFVYLQNLSSNEKFVWILGQLPVIYVSHCGSRSRIGRFEGLWPKCLGGKIINSEFLPMLCAE